jgi:hypothetical protein
LQPPSPACGREYWYESADGGMDGPVIDTENRFDSAFVLPASHAVSRVVCVDEWLAQSPRVIDSITFDVDQFFEREEETSSSSARQTFSELSATPKSGNDSWCF